MEKQSRESQEARCLFALREARTSFINDLLSCAYEHLGSPKKLSDVDRVLLRSEETFAIAEFYYMLEENKLPDPHKIRLFLQGHNEAMREYASNKDRRDLIGLSKSRAEEAIFTEPQIEKVVQHCVGGRLRLDQTDLGKLLASIVSAETTRKAIVALAKAGLINRINATNVLLISNGKLEHYFRKHLTAIVSAVKAGAQRSRRVA